MIFRSIINDDIRCIADYRTWLLEESKNWAESSTRLRSANVCPELLTHPGLARSVHDGQVAGRTARYPIYQAACTVRLKLFRNARTSSNFTQTRRCAWPGFSWPGLGAYKTPGPVPKLSLAQPPVGRLCMSKPGKATTPRKCGYANCQLYLMHNSNTCYRTRRSWLRTTIFNATTYCTTLLGAPGRLNERLSSI